MESAVSGKGRASDVGEGGGLSGLAERKVENFLSDTVQGGGDAWDGLHLLGSDLCWIGSRAFFGKSCGEGKEVHHSCDSAASSDGSVYAFESFEGVRIVKGLTLSPLRSQRSNLDLQKSFV